MEWSTKVLLQCLGSDILLTLDAGELVAIDGYMNISLEKCEEHVEGVKKRSYGDAFVRGNNGTPLVPVLD